MIHHELLTLFNTIQRLEASEEELICTLFKPAFLKKNEFFLQEGKFNNQIAFLRKGMIRYFVYKKGEESTLEFTKEGEFIGEYQSFSNRKQSIQNLQAIEDCELLVISYFDLQHFFDISKNGNLIGRLIIEHRFNRMISQLLSIYMHTPEERYKYFVANYRDLLQRIPQYLLASYIGVQPQSLSRIRKRIAKEIS
ncbi:Crp/Fnr family transcriptional regulator [Sphingobacterium siyangense]|uniref:Crp/Fnr family transcriptional regulator n=1 Tax=Sphingobacterium siyangense TaxID=459529 RepID=UPI002FDA6144